MEEKRREISEISSDLAAARLRFKECPKNIYQRDQLSGNIENLRRGEQTGQMVYINSNYFRQDIEKQLNQIKKLQLQSDEQGPDFLIFSLF